MNRHRPRQPLLRAALLLPLAAAGCTDPAPADPAFDPVAISAITIGRSTRADVFTALGRPARAEQGSAGETWFFEAHASPSTNSSLMSGAGSAAATLGGFVPVVGGLVAPGLGLANAARGASPPPHAATMAVSFGPNGIVRDCLYTSNDIPAGLPGGAAVAPACGRAPPS